MNGTGGASVVDKILRAFAGHARKHHVAVRPAAEAIVGPHLDLVLLEIGAVNLELSDETRHDRDVVARYQPAPDFLVVRLPDSAEAAQHAALAVGGIRNLHIAKTHILDVAGGSIGNAYPDSTSAQCQPLERIMLRGEAVPTAAGRIVVNVDYHARGVPVDPRD